MTVSLTDQADEVQLHAQALRDQISRARTSNPPFGIALQFAVVAIEIAAGKVALLLPTKWAHGDRRSRWLATTPLRRILFITPRPSMPPGPVIEAGIAPGGGKEDFAWFIWERGYVGASECGWLRKERDR